MTASAANKWTKRKLRAIGSGLEFNITYVQDSGWILPLLGSQRTNTRLGCMEMGLKEIIILGRTDEEIYGHPQAPIPEY